MAKTYFENRMKELTMEQLANVPPKETPLSKEEEDWARRRMPVFDIGAEIAKETKIATAPLSGRPYGADDWLWEKDVDLGWLGKHCVQVYGSYVGDAIEDFMIMLGDADITNSVPDNAVSDLIAEIKEEGDCDC